MKDDYGLNVFEIDNLFGPKTGKVRTRKFAKSPLEARNFDSLIESESERV